MKAPPRRFEALWETLRFALGADAVRSPSAAWEAEMRPAAVVAPETETQILEVLRVAAAQRIPVVPAGGGTKQGWGGPPAADAILLSMERLDAVIEHDPGNFTATVQAGCTIARLREALRAAGQDLPVDAAFPERATVGGVVSANANGPRRLRYGGIRDLLLGARAVLGDGETINVGGKVVKNVAGYDLTKLYAGAFGSIGIVTRATFRLAPVPEARATFVVPVPNPEAGWRIGRAVHDSELLPDAIALVADAGRLTLAIAADGFREMVDAHRGVVTRLAAADGLAPREIGHAEEHAFWRGLDACLAGDGRICAQASLRPSRLPEFVERLWDASSASWVADLATGWVRIGWSETDPEVVARFRDAAEARGGRLVVTAAPRSATVSPWGASRSDAVWIERVKRELDPHGILNPGRLPGAS
jgi:glycolate oxidase FAD binding subunit